MSPTQFKLTQAGAGALTRLVRYEELPSWFTLATRIEKLYGIPIQDVGVSYIDSDGDEITLSTNEELEDYYATFTTGEGVLIKFSVKNIGALRAQQQPQPQRPSPGGNLFDIGEEDWQGLHIPTFPGVSFFDQRSSNPPPPPPKSPSSAFVETVETSSVEKVASNRSRSPSPQIITMDNSKGKAREAILSPVEEVHDDGSSVVSIIQSDTPVKQPVHVYDFDLEDGYVTGSLLYNNLRGRSRSAMSLTSRSASRSLPHIPRSRSRSRSLPRAKSSTASRSISRGISPVSPHILPIRFVPSPSPPIVNVQVGTPVVRVSSPSDPPTPVMEPVPDPPVATIEPGSSAAGASPSLSNDIAGLLNTLSSAFAAHPELSEGLRNIVRNASKGAYWSAERDAIVNNAWKAAETVRNDAAQAAQNAQEEAGRKVAEALGGIFRALANLVGTPSSPGAQQSNERSVAPEPRVIITPGRPASSDHIPLKADSQPTNVHISSPRPVSPLRSYRAWSPDPYPSPRGRPAPADYRYRPVPPPPGPPPPPGFRHHAPPPPGPLRPLLGHHHHLPPHPGRYFGPLPPPPFISPLAPWESPMQGLRRSSTLPSRFGPSRFGQDFQDVPPPPPPPPPSAPITAAARKAQLEEAKRYYKATKDEWRREKEQRRLEKERREKERMERFKRRERSHPRHIVVSSDEENPVDTPQIPSQSQSQPARMGTGFRQEWMASTEARDPLRQRVMQRLADMGLTPQTHSQLESLVNKHTRNRSAEPGKPTEDAMMERLLEDLFVNPVVDASGSRMTERPSIPGAWNV